MWAPSTSRPLWASPTESSGDRSAYLNHTLHYQPGRGGVDHSLIIISSAASLLALEWASLLANSGLPSCIGVDKESNISILGKRYAIPGGSSPPARIDNLLSRVASGHAHFRRRSHHDGLHVTDDACSQVAQVLLGLLSLRGDVGGFVVGAGSVEVVVGSGG